MLSLLVNLGKLIALVDVISTGKSKVLENEGTRLVNQSQIEEIVTTETQLKLEADMESTGIF